jgi:lysozyme
MGGTLTPGHVTAMHSLLDGMDAPKEAQAGRRAINAAGLQIIKESEGCVLTAYVDPVGILTIGYGSTGSHVKPGLTITQAQAEELLRSDLRRFEDSVDNLTPNGATDNQFAAMVSLSFNVGAAALAGSTLLKKHNAGDFAGAENEFAKWVKAGGRTLPGLVKRRAKEAALYGKPS